MSVIDTRVLSKKYGRVTALDDCTLTLPESRLIALVGPNGAGKSTLLNLVVGLVAPTSGEISVLDGSPPGSPAALDAIAYVAQDTPLYRNLSAADAIHMTRNLNHRFDTRYAESRLLDLGIDPGRKASALSGGQRAQLALTLALARRPRLLVLDEPTASLDPLARHDFMATVMTAMADDGVTVLLSSHVLAELERVADHFVLLAEGRVRVEGPVEDLLASHHFVTGPVGASPAPHWHPIQVTGTAVQQHLLVRSESDRPAPPDWQHRPVTLEELAMAYLREGARADRTITLEAVS